MQVAPNLPIWLAQAITNFSETQRLYALRWALNEMDPRLLPQVANFCNSYRPAMSRQCQLLVDQIAYKARHGAGQMNGYQSNIPMMSGYHANAGMGAVNSMASRAGMGSTGLNGLGFWGGFGDLDKTAEAASKAAASASKAALDAISKAVGQNMGTPPPPGSQLNPTGYGAGPESEDWMGWPDGGYPTGVPVAPPRTPAPARPTVPTTPTTPPPGRMSGTTMALIGLGVVAAGVAVYAATR